MRAHTYNRAVFGRLATKPSRRQQNRPPRNLLATIFNSAIIDTVHLPEIVTSSLSPNTSLSIVIETLRRTSQC